MSMISSIKNAGSFLASKAASLFSGGADNKYFMSLANFIGGMGSLWKSVDDRKLVKEGYSKNIDLFSVIDYMTDKAGTVKWVLKRRLPDGTSEIIDDPSHPVKKLWANPNPVTNGSLFVQEQLAFKLVNGNRYMYGIQPNSQRPFMELWTMAPANVEIVVGGIGDENGPIESYRISGAWDKEIEPEKVKHGKTFNPDHDDLNFLYGMSPLKAAAVTLQRSNESYLTSWKLFKNMGANGAMVGDGEWSATPTEIKKMRKRWLRDYGGGENANGVAFLPGKNMKWIDFGMSPADLEVLKSQNFDLERFCNLYHMPIQLFNQERTYNDNIREAKKAAWNDAIIPELNSLLADVNSWLLPGWNKALDEDLFFVLDFSEIPELQVDISAMVKWLLDLHDRGLIDGNTVLRKLGLPEGDDKLLSELRIRLRSGQTVPIEDQTPPAAASSTA